ncbi:Os10g0152000 [Oryza sativa Japonica Group]|uniref:Os10g0152000 protein n=1 Tax=Oryza sativa subsp. japonica TaxID=39947 RepID=C7J7T4_ORYSJ|nr:Os10g0152000 [Oryza sativa Japonica Group]|eukprot:NP_001176028.1 Os10g0152000 [Oryza sativa Japonica Group]
MATCWLLASLLLLASAAGDESVVTGRPAGCQARCGDVDIPYPFGIGPNCSRGEGFEIACNTRNGNGDLVPTLAAANGSIHVQSLSVEQLPEVKVMLPVAYKCYDAGDNVTRRFYGDVDLNNNGVYRISDSRNMFVVIGCNTLSYTQNGNSGGSNTHYSGLFYTGCVTYCNDSRSAQDGRCAGVGCCHVDISPGLTDNVVSFGPWTRGFQVDFSPCDYSFLVDKNEYEFRSADLKMDLNRTMPVWLDWAIRDSVTCPPLEVQEKKPAGYACVSDNSECVNSTNGPGYYCKCKQGYEGNPYDKDQGCKDINECDVSNKKKYPCYGVCNNIPGDYECHCRVGYQWSGEGPKKQECSSKFPLAARLALGITLGFSFLIVAVLFTLMMHQKRKMNEYFKKNGGSVLQKVDNVKIFSKDELKKITKNNSEVLGQGGFGKVYKGTLEDNTTVAVKTSIEVNEARKDDFTNEVIIQSQMMHNNIIKLLGCCLEVDVPMLVYEFAAKGNLQDILHGDANIPLPLGLRLNIAIESAEGLRYMHSSTSRTIRHGDVKPANILLTDKFIPKISYFGTSKLLTVDKDFTMFVVGSMGYIDPVFHKTGHLTQKSDVYSFGVVLLELICRKPTIYGENCSLIIEFQNAYDQENSGRIMFDKEIAKQEDILILEEIGRLAMECLKEKVEERPDMKEGGPRGGEDGCEVSLELLEVVRVEALEHMRKYIVGTSAHLDIGPFTGRVLEEAVLARPGPFWHEAMKHDGPYGPSHF